MESYYRSVSLPNPGNQTFGREAELQCLDTWLAAGESPVLQIVAPAGVGKTQLLWQWLERSSNRLKNYVAWSFSAQGTRENAQASAADLFDHLRAIFGLQEREYHSDHERACFYFDVLQKHACVLILDGLEALQIAQHNEASNLSDSAMQLLLNRIVTQPSQYMACRLMLSTRTRLAELCHRSGVHTEELTRLEKAAGLALLRSLNIRGSDEELAAVVDDYHGHPLSLHLLGRALSLRAQGNIRQRDTIIGLLHRKSEYVDAPLRRVDDLLKKFHIWLDEAPHVQLVLYCAALFDRTVEKRLLLQLCQQFNPQEDENFSLALNDLERRYGLLFRSGALDEDLDMHPVVREFFAACFKNENPQQYQQAQLYLAKYFAQLVPEGPAQKESDIQILYRALAHGCGAGMHQRVMEELYQQRIQREGQYYTTDKLGKHSDDLAALKHFFAEPWSEPVTGLKPEQQRELLNWVAYRLRAQGRLAEAGEAGEAALALALKEENWKKSASIASNLSAVYLAAGQITLARECVYRSLEYANRTGNPFRRMASLSSCAEVEIQAGDASLAMCQLQLSLPIQQADLDIPPFLYSVSGYRYHQLLLDKSEIDQDELDHMEALIRKAMEYATEQKWPLSQALEQLNLGRLYEKRGDYKAAQEFFNQALEGLLRAGDRTYLPHGYIQRAIFFLNRGDDIAAEHDLKELYHCADLNGLLLAKAEYYLLMGRLYLQRGLSSAREQLALARELIDKTGYARLNAFLAQLNAQYAGAADYGQA